MHGDHCAGEVHGHAAHRAIHPSPEVGDAPGSSGPSECSFSWPFALPRVSPVRQGCYRAPPVGWKTVRTLPPFGAVIVIWPELPSAVQSGVFCARAGRRGAGEGPVYVFGTSGSDGAGGPGPAGRRRG